MNPINSKLAVALLLLSTPAFATGICIVCPPGYDCSTGTPALDGTTGQVLTRTANGAEWDALPAAPTLSSLGGVPTTRTIAGFDLSGDITVQQLRDVLDACNLPAAGTPGGGTVEYRCSTTNGTQNVAGNPGSATSGQYCWCRYSKNDFTKVLTGTACGITKYSAWVFHGARVSASSCADNCAYYCSDDTYWRPASVW